MSILVTGGAGYIGSHMVLALRDAGEDVAVIDNLSTGYRPAVPGDVELVIGDVGDRALLDATLARRRVRSIIHFAGSIVVPESVANPLAYYHNNTANSRTLMEAAIAAGVKTFIFSSTAAVYGNPASNPVREDADLRPMSPYGSSKLMTEIMLADTSRAHDFRYVALRYFNVAGADPAGRAGQSTPRATHLIKVACEAALGKRGHMEVFGTTYPTRDGTCERDYIHVSDLAAAHMAALAHLKAGGASDTFNCGYGRGFTVLEVIAAVRRAANDVKGRDFTVRMAPPRAGDPAAIVASADRIRQVLGWQPAYDDLDAIVASALAWEQTLS